MLSYHVNYFQVLTDTGFYLFLPSLVLLALLVVSWIVHRVRHQKNQGMLVLLAILTGLTVAFSLALPVGTQGAGWTLNGRTLTVKAGSATTTVHITQAKVRWVSKTGGYALKSKITGTSAGPLNTGTFSLKGGQHAQVFEYGNHPLLAVQSGKTLVLLSSPKIQELKRAAAHPALAAPSPVAPHHAALPKSLSAANIGMAALIVFTLIQMGLSRHYAPRLPDQVATNFGLSGQATGYTSRRAALWMGPSLAVFIGLLGLVIADLSPHQLSSVIPILIAQVMVLAIMLWIYRKNLTTSQEKPHP